MVDLSQAKSYLDTIGLSEVPDFELEAWLEVLKVAEPCLAAYTEAVRKLLLTYLIGLFALSRGYKYVSSKHAPSGASISYKYADSADAWARMVSYIKTFDTNHCLDDLIPKPEKATDTNLAFFVVGGCHE